MAAWLQPHARAAHCMPADVTVSQPPEKPQRSLQDAGVPMACTRVVMNQIVMPSEVDTMGICIGGQVSEVDEGLLALALPL